MPPVLVLRTAGTNCDEETAHAFRVAGADVECLHVSVFVRGERALSEFDILAFPGGFSYGDDLGAGTVLAGKLRTRLSDDLNAFVESGKLVIGICNGFQVLVRLGILPGWDGGNVASLIENVSGKFEDRWVRLGIESTRSPFLRFAGDSEATDAGAAGTGSSSPRLVRFPVAHREGRFVLRDPDLIERLREGGQIAFTYRHEETGESADGAYPANPNGSVVDIAGICNPAGNVLGLMPHPERFLHLLHDPLWTRSPRRPRDIPAEELERAGDGFPLFQSAVRFADNMPTPRQTVADR